MHTPSPPPACFAAKLLSSCTWPWASLHQRWQHRRPDIRHLGSTLRFEDGSLMDNFYSKLLKRTFTRIRFVGAVLVTVEP